MTVIEKLELQIVGLQDVVSFLKNHENLANELYCYPQRLQIRVYGKSKEDKKRFSSLARSLSSGIRRLPKEYSDYDCSVMRIFNERVSLGISIQREAVCERIVKETKEVAGYYVEPHTEEVIEWECK